MKKIIEYYSEVITGEIQRLKIVAKSDKGYKEVKWNCDIICKVEMNKIRQLLVHANMEFLAILRPLKEPLSGFRVVTTDIEIIKRDFSIVENIDSYIHNV